MRLYSTLLSANGRKPIILSKLLGKELEYVEINVYQGQGRSPDFLAIQPTGKIPVLVDGQHILSESNAILLYIADKSRPSPYMGTSLGDRYKIYQWLFWESSQWQPILTDLLRQHVGHLLLPALVPKPNNSPKWEDGTLQKQLQYLDNALSSTGFLVGEHLTVADISVVGMMTYFQAMDFPFEKTPHLKRWFDGIQALDAWKETQVSPWKGKESLD